MATATLPAAMAKAPSHPIGETTGADDSGGSVSEPVEVVRRKRGRPRKYQDLTDDEQKERRAVDNRHAAKRSYYRRVSKMSELEDVRPHCMAVGSATLAVPPCCTGPT